MIDMKLFIDGSYKRTEPDVTKGGALLVIGDVPVACRRFLTQKEEFVSGWNEGGELLAAMCGLWLPVSCMQACEMEQARVEINYDYKGIEMYIQGQPKWHAKSERAKLYVAIVEEYRKKYPGMYICFNKVKAHTGVQWNEAVDSIANGIFTKELEDVRMPDFVW